MAKAPAQTRRVTPASIVLVVAALLAVAAIIVSVMRSEGEETTTANAAAAPSNAQAAAGPDPNAMIASLRARLAQDPDNHEAWYMLGQTLRQTNQFSEAESAFRRAMELQPGNAVYVAYVAESLLLQEGDDKRQQARELFQRAATIDSREPMVRFYLATMADQDGQHQAAIDQLIALLREAPAGAPWEPQVRSAVEAIARTRNIDIANRLPPVRTPPPSTATAAIPGPTREQMEAARGIAPAEQDQMVKGMVDRLAARLRTNPRDAEGWIRLMRSRMVLNDPAAAREALQTALTTFQDDAATQQRLRQAASELAVPER